MPNSRRARRILWGLVAVVALALVALRLDASLLKHPIERLVSARTGRAFEIRGGLQLHLLPHLRFVMERVRFANPDWANEPEMLRIERADFSIAALPLLHGRLVLPEVILTKPIVDLERSEQSAPNWTLAKADTADEKRGAAPVIGRLNVDEGVLMFYDPAQKTALTLTLQTAPLRNGERGVRFNAYGRYRGERLDAEGSGGSILSLADATLPYPIDGTFRVGATGGSLSGTITGLATFAAADLSLELHGASASDLYPIFGLSLPPTPPYRVQGRLIREPPYWRFHHFQGSLGDSDLSGDLDVAYVDGRARLTAKATSQRLDLDDLAGFIGAQPQAGPGEAATPQQEARKAQAKAEPNVLPDMPIKLDRLRAMDADVQFAGESLRGRTPIDRLTTHLVLDDGVLTAKPLDFAIGGGDVKATLILDGRGDRARVGSDFELRRIDLRRLFPGSRVFRQATGVIGGKVALKGEGDSLADVLAGADGHVGLAMSGGTITNLGLKIVDLDLQDIVKLLFTGDKAVQLRCAVADLSVQDGVVTSNATVIDTSDTNLGIDGQVDLAKESLDVTLHPLPKDYSLLSLRSPIHVRGTFKQPAIRPDRKLVERTAVVAALAALAPPLAALAGTIETAPGKDADCGHLIAAVEQHAGEGVPEAEGR